jgi:hypothetical protein
MRPSSCGDIASGFTSTACAITACEGTARGDWRHDLFMVTVL